MYPSGIEPQGELRLGYWPFNAATAVFGSCNDGLYIRAVATGKTFVLRWEELYKMAEDEGVLIEEPEAVPLASMLPGLPGEQGQ